MSEQTRQQAEKLTTAIEEAAQLRLPDPVAEVMPLDKADAPTSAAIQTRMNEIDMESTGSIIGFGSRAQLELQTISQQMLADVRNKDVGPAGDSLRNIVSTIRGFSAGFRSANWTPAANAAGGND